MGAFETNPFLVVSGYGFVPGQSRSEDTSLLDIAPTVLAHLGLDASGVDGKALQSTADHSV